jgi:hypothetical protein
MNIKPHHSLASYGNKEHVFFRRDALLENKKLSLITVRSAQRLAKSDLQLAMAELNGVSADETWDLLQKLHEAQRELPREKVLHDTAVKNARDKLQRAARSWQSSRPG